MTWLSKWIRAWPGPKMWQAVCFAVEGVAILAEGLTLVWQQWWGAMFFPAGRNLQDFDLLAQEQMAIAALAMAALTGVALILSAATLWFLAQTLQANRDSASAAILAARAAAASSRARLVLSKQTFYGRPVARLDGLLDNHGQSAADDLTANFTITLEYEDGNGWSQVNTVSVSKRFHTWESGQSEPIMIEGIEPLWDTAASSIAGRTRCRVRIRGFFAYRDSFDEVITAPFDFTAILTTNDIVAVGGAGGFDVRRT